MLHPRQDYQRIQDSAGLIPENEPVFLLRAQDKVAARTVRAWANYNLDAGGDPQLSKMAREHADLMDQWPVKKLADLPATPATEPVEPPPGPNNVPPAEQPAEQPAESPTKPASKEGSGVATEPAESESKPDAGILSKLDESENKPDSGVV